MEGFLSRKEYGASRFRGREVGSLEVLEAIKVEMELPDYIGMEDLKPGDSGYRFGEDTVGVAKLFPTPPHADQHVHSGTDLLVLTLGLVQQTGSGQ
jgi:hypothetical protein